MRARHDELDNAENERLDALLRGVFPNADDAAVREQLHAMIHDYSREDARTTLLTGPGVIAAAALPSVPSVRLNPPGGA